MNGKYRMSYYDPTIVMVVVIVKFEFNKNSNNNSCDVCLKIWTWFDNYMF
jgi:hypothetical protein